VSSSYRPRAALLAVLVMSLALAPVAPTQAQQRISLIRDAEIEATLDRFTRPIFEAAGLGPDAVNLYIVKDERLNAFVAGGMNMFFNTGLLMRTEHPGQLVGVVAHEAGHIAGGHLSRIAPAARRATTEMLLATVLGAAAAVAGAPGLGTAIIGGGQSYAAGNFLSFTRSQEQAADQAAISYLQRAGLPVRGLAEILRKLESQNALAVSSMSPYLRTHPLTRDRLLFVENHVRDDGGRSVPAAWHDAHARMVAKLDAFLKNPRRVLDEYANRDGLPAAYARTIALYRLPDLERALEEVDRLIAAHPDDPYFHELKGQMLFENGRVAPAVAPYQEAVRLDPDSALLRIGLGQALVETGAPAANAEAIPHLEEATQLEPTNATAWRLLGIAQGRDGQEGESALSFAEYALLTGKDSDARLYAHRAEEKIGPDHPAWLRLQDILRVIEES